MQSFASYGWIWIMCYKRKRKRKHGILEKLSLSLWVSIVLMSNLEREQKG
jgi:hypothetical protein